MHGRLTFSYNQCVHWFLGFLKINKNESVNSFIHLMLIKINVNIFNKNEQL